MNSKGKMFSLMIRTLLLVSMLTLEFNIQLAKTSGTIYIRADGSIDPPTASISSVENTTYIFTSNINDSIIVERDNIVVDGVRYTVQGTGSGTGIDLRGRSNVTIKDLEIKAFSYGVYLVLSRYNYMFGNNITNNRYGIYFQSSDYNDIVGNNITANDVTGIYLKDSSNNSVLENNITNNRYGIWLWWSSNNGIVRNNVTANIDVGIWLWGSSNNNRIFGNKLTNNNYAIYVAYSSYNNKLYHNNFINNTRHVYIQEGGGYTNFWDDGYPSGGNFWGDYNGTDLYSGSYQNITGSDGIGDTTYSVDENNQDNYPLIRLYGSIRNLDTDITYLTIQSAINAPETSDEHTIFVSSGTYYEHVVVNKSVSLLGGNRATTIIDGGETDTVVHVTVNNVSINEITIQNSGKHYPGWIGILLDFSNCSTISNNVLLNNHFGILLSGSSENSILDNTISNSYAGIFLEYTHLNESTGNIIIGNFISDNEYGIGIEECSGNTIYHNNFVDNTVQAGVSVPHLNKWNNGYPSGGNYWSDYTGVDVEKGPNQDEPGSDFIGDTPYIIDEKNRDRYPLTNLYGGPPPLTYTLTIAATNGTTNPILGTYTYSQGQNVFVQAIPHNRYVLDHWELDGSNVGSANPYSVLMDNNHTLHAVFVPVYTLTITTTAGGTTNPAPGVYTYAAGSSTQATAIPSTNYAFDHWELDGANIGAPNPISVTMDTNHTLHAVFMLYDVAVTNVTPSKTVVGQGYSIGINVTVVNQGDYTETFNVTVYADKNATVIGDEYMIGMLPVTLACGNDVIVMFQWNNTAVIVLPINGGIIVGPKGNYTITAEATILPSEADTTDNTLTDGWILVTIPGDVNGDRKVDWKDIYTGMIIHFMCKIGDPGYVPNSDVTCEGIIDWKDIYQAIIHFNESW